MSSSRALSCDERASALFCASTTGSGCAPARITRRAMTSAPAASAGEQQQDRWQQHGRQTWRPCISCALHIAIRLRCERNGERYARESPISQGLALTRPPISVLDRAPGLKSRHGVPRHPHHSRQAAAAEIRAGEGHRQPTSARWSTTCSRRCTTRPASGSPPSRSACRSASSPWTSPRRTSRPSRRSSSIRRSSGRRTRRRPTRKAACRSRNITRRSSGRRACRVKYLDLDGKPQEIEADGLLATCLQHEIDHLNGVLFIDHISKLKRDMVLKKFKKAAKHGKPSSRSPTTTSLRIILDDARIRGARAASSRRRPDLIVAIDRCAATR